MERSRGFQSWVGSKRMALAAAVALALLLGACTGNRGDIDQGPIAIFTPGTGESPGSVSPGPSASGSAAPSASASAGPSGGATGAPTGTLVPPNSGLQKPPTTVPVANIWSPSEDRIGITKSSIGICMHAAFLLGPAFGNNPQDEDVYWQMVNDPAGPYRGIYGRTVKIDFEDDQYTPQGATTAFNACKALNPFFVAAGVGFDQTPTVRHLAEEAKVPYLYSMATEKDTNGKPYRGRVAYTSVPTVEQVGRTIGDLVASRYPTKKTGIVFVDSDAWRAGRSTFIEQLKRRGVYGNLKTDFAVANNNADFTTAILDLAGKGVEVVYLHVNALAMTRFITQADGQGYHPRILGEDGFNLVPDTVGQAMRRFPPAQMVWVTPAFPDGSSPPWADEIKRMRNAYAKYRPNKTVNDVDWMFWLGFKGMHQLFIDCGRDCTRNKIAGLFLSGYRRSGSPMCAVDFSRGGGRFGGYLFNLFEAAGTGNTSYWHQTKTCVPGF